MPDNKPTKLHLCCGMRDFGKEWTHIDGFHAPHIDYLIRDLNVLPFEDNSFDLIYCSHAIGYFDREEIVPILKEWMRVLKPGGTLRLATPDFDTINYLYRTGQYELEQLLGLLYGKWEFETGCTSSVSRSHIYFKTTYDFVSLQNLLRSTGFDKINIYDYRDTEHSEFDDHSKAHLPNDPEAIRTGNFTEKHTLVSLNVECKKM